MAIFLSFIIIILIVVFESTRSSKLNALERKLTDLENYLKKLQFPQVQKQSTPKEEPLEDPAKKIIPEDIAPVIPPKVEPAPIPLHSKIAPPVEKEEIKEEQKEKNKEAFKNSTRPSVSINIQTTQPAIPKESWYTTFRKNNPDLEKFIGENILSKVAITILVLGIAFFVKYAIDKDWINEIARVGIGILCGGVVLGFAHRLHKKFKAFSSVLVAGGISVFYFTIGIAFHQYHIFGQTTAFIIMFLITGFSVFISIIYDRVELAALSIVGGFATPFMLSTGQGNYQVLFTYVLILDMGMLVLAYLRKWNLINILAYCFTSLLYLIWLESKVIGDPRAPYKGALLFGAIFYVVFVLMNIINNIKEKRKFDTFELSILISNTFLFYGEGMHILNYYHHEWQGLFSICMAVFNLICAWLLFKKFKADERLVYLMIGLTLTFITISAPVQLHGNYITLFWALEGLLLMWLAQKSKIVLYRFASVLISSLMVLSLFTDWIQVYQQYSGIMQHILLNKGFITGIVSAFSLGAIILLLKKETLKSDSPGELLRFAGIDFHAKNYSSFLRAAFIVLLYFTGLLELIYQLRERTDGKVAFYIVVEAYHLLYVSVLNITLSRYKNTYLNKTLHVLNLMTVLIFILGFVLLPIFDFKENIIHREMNYTGFIFHYISLIAAAFISFRISGMTQRKDVSGMNYPVLNTAVISAALVYICSAELILHVAQLSMKNVSEEINSTMILKLTEFHTTSLHVVKIGFPILWGALAFIFLSVGMKKHNKTFRISGLILIAFILLKLFTYDIKEASEAGKIIAFIILGVVLLVISFMYQKIKALLLDDTKKNTEEKETE